MSPKFWENTTSQEQVNEAEAKLQLSAAELLKEEKQNLCTGALFCFFLNMRTDEILFLHNTLAW